MPSLRSERTILALHAIRDNAHLAKEFTAGFTLETFSADRRTFYAVTRCLEILSEAARRLPATLRQRHPDLPWRAIMGVGNIYRHDYDSVAEELVWRTVQQSLGTLLAVVDQEIDRLAGGDPGTC